MTASISPDVTAESSEVVPVELRFAALPEHVRTARLVAVALARRAGVEEGVLDEVRLAVAEACTRAVGLHHSYQPHEPVLVVLTESPKRFGVEVVDVVPQSATADGALVADADDEEAPLFDADMGLAVLQGLVDDLDITAGPDGGVIRMSWPR